MSYKLQQFVSGGVIPTTSGGSEKATAGVAQEAGGS